MSDEAEDRLGMTPEQWAWFQEYTHGFGDQDENGIDLSLIREQLRLTPGQRLRQLQEAQDFLRELRQARSPAVNRALAALHQRDHYMETPVLDFEQLLSILEAVRLEYVLIGGVALWLHGCAMLTESFDILIDRDPDALRRMMQALIRLGVAVDWLGWKDGCAEDAASDPTHRFSTRAGRVVVLIGEAPGAGTYAELRRKTVEQPLNGHLVQVASLDDLEQMKKALDRTQDKLHLMHIGAIRTVQCRNSL